MFSAVVNARRVVRVVLCAVLFGSFLMMDGGSVTCDAQTTWGNVAIGGGGYITGVVYDPSATGVIYAHTDVGGAYKWNPSTNSWTQLLGWLSPSQSSWQGCESIAIDPTDSSGNTVYAAVGEYSADWATPSHGDILKSIDGGQTWATTGLGTGYQSSLVDYAGVGIGSNWSQGYRERLVVDPNKNQVLFYASAGFGLWKSTNGGGSWQQVTAAPVGDTTGIGQTGATGLVWTAIDPTSGSSGTQSKTIYLGVPGTSSQSFAGVWVSINGGTNWSKLSGSPLSPQQGVVGSDGTLYVTHTSGVAKYKAGVWTNITPASGQGYGAIAIDPFNPQRLMTNGFYWGFGNPLYLSINGGTSWTTLNNSYQSVAQWWPTDFWAAAVSSINFDPFVQDTVTYSDWYGVWKTTAISAATPSWTNLLAGHEETVVLALTSPASGPELVSGVADDGGYAHSSLTQFPTDSFGLDLSLPDVTGLDFSETTPSFVVMAGGNRNATVQAAVAYSANGGATWTPLNNTASIGQDGRVAVSATNTAKIIWLPPGASPEYTTNTGSTWKKSTGGSAALYGSGAFLYSQPLAADRVNGSYAYLADSNTGNFYYSSNFGTSWTLSAASLPNNGGGSVTVEAAPGLAGNVWLEVAGAGLYASTNYGQAFTPISAVSSPEFFSFGAPQQAGGSPAAYVLGVVGGIRGVYRSTDLGANWTRIDIPAVGIAQPTAMKADRQVFGRVFIGTNGLGILQGNSGSGGGGTVATPTFSPAAGTYTSAQTVTISDTTSGATVYYTTNGTTPTTSSTTYTGPITVSSTETIKTIAAASGYSNSAVASATYTINLPNTATPSFSPAAGTYSNAQSVTISTSTSGASIRYTTDGSTPSETAGTLYSSPVTISSTTTLKAIAYKTGLADSAITTGVYTIASISVNQSTSASGSGTSVAVTFGSANVAGHLIVANVAWNGTATVQSVTDSAGNTYAQAVAATCDTNQDCSAIWYAANIRAGGSNRVTATFSASVGWNALDIAEFSAVSTLDKTATGTGNSSAAATSSATTTAANELIIGAGNTESVFTAAGSGFTWFGSTNGTGSEYKIVNATGSYKTTGTVQSNPWAMQMATFR